MARFTHDCEGCASLGFWGEFDLYVCGEGGDTTVIARYGDEGKQYASSLLKLIVEGEAPEYDGAPMYPPATVALIVATERVAMRNLAMAKFKEALYTDLDLN